MEKLQYRVVKSLDHSYVRVTEKYTETYTKTLHVKKMADLVAVT